MGKWKQIIIIFIVPILFFILSLAVLYDYGVNWDTLQHFARGQIYFRYLTTGKKDTVGVPDICRNDEGTGSTVDAKTGRICDRNHVPRISFYEQTSLNFPWTEKMTIGHPPLTDILLAGSNQFFYKTLGLVEDIQGYHLFIVCITFFMACIVAIWSYQCFGLFASFISVVTLYTYPLLFAEQHFNPKDPAVASYFTAFLYFLWLGISRKKVLPIIIASFFAGISLGTKFNILFAIPIIGIWFIFFLFQHTLIYSIKSLGMALKKIVTPGMAVACVSIPIVAFVIFFSTYPALWISPFQKIISVVDYYRNIGGSRCFYPPLAGKWFWECTNFHTLRLYGTTLPIVTVILSGFGLLLAFKTIGQYFFAPFLWAVWLLVTLGRATLPIGSLYGGSLRQIMEFIPAAALLSGFGAIQVRQEIIKRLSLKKSGLLVSFFILVLYVPVFITMMRLHPNENLYFNILAGGLKGAVDKKFEVATNTYGNGYKQAIDWINKNVPVGGEVYLAEGIGSAVPSILFRSDIHYKGSISPVVAHDGSFIMELEAPGMDISEFHTMRLLHLFMKPIHEVVVDGVVVASVWKNDEAYVQNVGSLDNEKPIEIIKTISPANDEIILDVGTNVYIKRIDMDAMSQSCSNAMDVLLVFVSHDGINYSRLLENSYRENDNDSHASLWIGAFSRFVKLYTYKPTSCSLPDIRFKAFSF